MTYQDYPKLRTALRYWLQGRNYHTALTAMDFALRYHIGILQEALQNFDPSRRTSTSWST